MLYFAVSARYHWTIKNGNSKLIKKGLSVVDRGQDDFLISQLESQLDLVM